MSSESADKMPFESAHETLVCDDCAASIACAQARRKVPRCDDCEVRSALGAFEHATGLTRHPRMLAGGALGDFETGSRLLTTDARRPR